MNQDSTSQWIPISEACERLNISHHVASRLIREYRIPTRNNPVDKREKLVDVQKLAQVVNR